MELVKPDVGLIFWMTVSFGILLYILSRFAWPVIMKALREREQKISEALESAARARDEMARLKAENELILMQARQERSHDCQCTQNCRKNSGRIETARPKRI